MSDIHTFLIPVMGTGFTIDAPIKVARYGISSVIPLVDDTLVEQAREFYCKKIGEKYIAITKNEDDYRAKRITAYLDLVHEIVKKQFAQLKASAFQEGSEITKYFELLPRTSPLKLIYEKMLKTIDVATKAKLQDELRERIERGSIDANIMTKLDRPNFTRGDHELPPEFSDAMAALRGFAKSTLSSAIVFSAGFNRRLYGYVENFKDFYADANGVIKKKIVIKVSDYRSCLTQGKFFAKKGLWISEYRIESGLNCGGHVFPSAGQLLGPILNEFKERRQELTTTLHLLCNIARRLKKMAVLPKPPKTLITVQGGIGTHSEDKFLLNHYGVDQTGWATPFLLCPEVVSVDDVTFKKLCDAKEADLYTSNVSPVGAPFNNLKGALSELEKERRISENCYGSPCPKGHLAFNTEFTNRPICIASSRYQGLKIKQLDKQRLTREGYEKACRDTLNKSCICHDLGGAFLIKNKIIVPPQKAFPAICPGPNMAYFSRIFTLSELVDHIYGRTNILDPVERPHMFLKEIEVNIDFLEKEVDESLPLPPPKQVLYFAQFWRNLLGGIHYYEVLFNTVGGEMKESCQEMQSQLQLLKERLDRVVSDANKSAKMHISEKLHTLTQTIKRSPDKESTIDE